MPCVTPLATGRTLEFGWVSELLKEAYGGKGRYGQVDYDYYGHNPAKLDELTDQLCTRCHELGEGYIATMTPHFRYWWMRHKMHDALREFRTQLGLNRTNVPGD